MNPKQFFDLVVVMRREQRAYFRSKGLDKNALNAARNAERLVDEEIKRVELVTKEKLQPRFEL